MFNPELKTPCLESGHRLQSTLKTEINLSSDFYISYLYDLCVDHVSNVFTVACGAEETVCSVL